MQKDVKEKFIPGKTRIKYGGAVVDQRELSAIQTVLKRNWWTLDAEGDLFEKELAKKANTKFALFTNSGSSALFLAILSLQLPHGSEIIIPAVNFPTLVSPCLLVGLTPVYVDIDLHNLCLDMDKAAKAITKKTRAIAVVNIAGNTIDISKLKPFKERGIVTILDNCDGFGSTYNGKAIESYFDIAATSFHAAHIITTGEGGALFTNNEELYKRSKSLCQWGRAEDSDVEKMAKKSGLPDDYPGRYTYVTRGFNLKPLELQAAMGRVQLKKLKKIKKARLQNFMRLYKGIEKLSLPFLLPEQPPKTDISWFAFPFTLLKPSMRGDLRHFLEKKNIETRVIFAGNITRQPAYKESMYKIFGTLENSDRAMSDSFFISVHPTVTKPMITYILKSFEEYFLKGRKRKN